MPRSRQTIGLYVERLDELLESHPGPEGAPRADPLAVAGRAGSAQQKPLPDQQQIRVARADGVGIQVPEAFDLPGHLGRRRAATHAGRGDGPQRLAGSHDVDARTGGRRSASALAIGGLFTPRGTVGARQAAGIRRVSAIVGRDVQRPRRPGARRRREVGVGRVASSAFACVFVASGFGPGRASRWAVPLCGLWSLDGLLLPFAPSPISIASRGCYFFGLARGTIGGGRRSRRYGCLALLLGRCWHRSPTSWGSRGRCRGRWPGCASAARATTRAAWCAEGTAWLSELARRGFEFTETGDRDYDHRYLMRYRYPAELLWHATIEDQAMALSSWVTDTFELLISRPPTNDDLVSKPPGSDAV